MHQAKPARHECKRGSHRRWGDKSTGTGHDKTGRPPVGSKHNSAPPAGGTSGRTKRGPLRVLQADAPLLRRRMVIWRWWDLMRCSHGARVAGACSAVGMRHAVGAQCSPVPNPRPAAHCSAHRTHTRYARSSSYGAVRADADIDTRGSCISEVGPSVGEAPQAPQAPSGGAAGDTAGPAGADT